MSIPESMKQITEAAEKLIAPDDIQSSFIISEEQLKKQEQRIIFQRDAPDKTEQVLGDEFKIKVADGITFVVRKGVKDKESINRSASLGDYVESRNALMISTSKLYRDIDRCITNLVDARRYKDGRDQDILFQMESLMVAALQQLGCVIDYLEKEEKE